MNTYDGWVETPYCAQIAPGWSFTCGNAPTPRSSMNACIASSESRAAMPTNVTSGFACCTSATAGASRRQVGHQGAQNHRTVSVPSMLFRSIWPPPTRPTTWAPAGLADSDVSDGAAPEVAVSEAPPPQPASKIVADAIDARSMARNGLRALVDMTYMVGQVETLGTSLASRSALRKTRVTQTSAPAHELARYTQ